MTMRRWVVSMAAVALACACARGALVINEVCYSNSSVPDETGDKTSDWLELYNPGPTNINVSGYGVGDDKTSGNNYKEANGVLLPSYVLPPGGFLLLFASSTIAADYVAWTNAPNSLLVATNAVWRYCVTNAAPAATWNTNTFNDASWGQGVAALGYDDTKQNLDCGTVVGYGGNASARYTTTYFRNSFRVLNPSVVTGLQMNARINDGMIVYLNGREAYRYNMTGGAVGYGTFALTSRSATQWVSALLATNGLVQGTNVVAVEVHQASASSPDMILDLALTALVNEQVPIVHGLFGLSSSGEKAYLFNPNGSLLQSVPNPGAMATDASYGTAADGITNTFKVYTTPTPRLPNATYTPKYLETLTSEKPIFSCAPGVYASTQTLRIDTVTYGLKVYYTLDGSDPRYSSTYLTSGSSMTVSNLPPNASSIAWRRTNPVEIGNSDSVPTAAWVAPVGNVSRATVIRAVTVSNDGTQCSPETQGTYFIGGDFTNRTLPLVSITTDTNNLFGFETGLFVPGKHYANSPEGYGSNKWGKPYANYHQDGADQEWERKTYFELFESSQATASVAQVLGVAMYGGGTRAIPQKTLYMIARQAEYGADRVFHSLFPSEAPTSYKRFLLRNSGNDWYGPDNAGVSTMMKDATFQQIIRRLSISTMAYRPTVAYVDGVYWGLHNLRESYDKHYLATRYGIDPDNADILMHEEDTSEIGNVLVTRVDGNKKADDDYEAFLDLVLSNSVTVAANYQNVVQHYMDVTNYMDYIIGETFFANTDWPINNCDFWRAHTNETASCGAYGDTRWRWMLYDLDLAGEKGASYNMLNYLNGSQMTGRHEPAFLFYELRQNASFRLAFIDRYVNYLNTTFRPARMASIIAQNANAIAPEIETHYRRWGRSYTQGQWRQAVTNTLFNFTAARYDASWSHLNTFFTLGGTGALLVSNVSVAGIGGHFVVNGVSIETTTDGVTNRASWSGTFFQSSAVPVCAVPDTGYVFDGWVGSAVTSAVRSVSVGGTPTRLVARFRLAAAPAHVASGYEAWQLANYSEQEILDGSTAASSAASGRAGMSNFELYAFGMNRADGLSDAQRLARASLSIGATNSALWVGYARLNASHTDVQYALQAATALSSTTVWHTVVSGADIKGNTMTSVLDTATWYLSSQLPSSTSTNRARFYRLSVSQP